MKFKRSIVAVVAALALMGGATACNSSTPVHHQHTVVHVHTYVPAPVHTVVHVHITPKAKATLKKKTRPVIVVHKH